MGVREIKQERDDLRKEVRSISSDNRQRISDLKGLFLKAGDLKSSRNRENELSNEFRLKRDSKKEEILALKAQVSELRKKISSAGGGNPLALQEEIEHLEWIQQTEASSPREEKEFAKKIAELRKQMPQAREFQQLYAEYSQVKAKLGKLIGEEKALHDKVVEHSRKADDSHKQLLAESRKIDGIQKNISSSLEFLKEKEGMADEKHKELVNVAGERKIREMEEHQKEQREHAKRMDAQQRKIVEKGKEIFDRFKGGGKISYEEMLVLQQSGLL